MLYKKILVLTTILVALYATVSYSQFGPEKDIVAMSSYLSLNKVYPGTSVKIAAKLSIENGWHINSNKPHDESLIATNFTIDSGSAFTLNNTVYPDAQDIKLSFSDEPLSVWEGTVYIGGILNVSKNLKPGSYPLIVNLEYQSCNNISCMPPRTIRDTLSVNIAGNSEAYSEINQDIFRNINYASVSPAAADGGGENSITSTLEHSGFILSLLFVFIGGLALNLTPCVYPLIPITVGFFGGQSEGSTKKLFFMGLFFVLGMALTYSVVGVVTALSGAVFGSLLQNTYVVIFISLIFVVLSLSMFGVYEFNLPSSIVTKAGGAKSGFYGAFFMGLTMGIVAAPCIGPFVLGLVTYVAAKADPYYGFMMFFFLALGLGFPYLILAVFSGKIKKLPRAGEWMEAVKHIFGFILLGMALYFLLPLLPEGPAGYVLPVFMIIAGIYIVFVDKYANKIKGFRIFKIAFSTLLVAAAVYLLIPSQKNSIDWKPYNQAALPVNVKGSKGTIIDFYADWCIPCKELDAKTFTDPKVIAAAKDFRAYKADMTKSLSPDVESLRNKFDIIGVPTVLILNSRGHEVKRITGFVDADQFYKLLESVD